MRSVHVNSKLGKPFHLTLLYNAFFNYLLFFLTAPNFLTLATTLENLGARWLLAKKVNFVPCNWKSHWATPGCIAPLPVLWLATSSITNLLATLGRCLVSKMLLPKCSRPEPLAVYTCLQSYQQASPESRYHQYVFHNTFFKPVTWPG